MTAPFYPDIKGTTSGAPGTGAFTPNAAASTYRAWSTVPIWVGLVRYEDGTAWELSWSYWNGTTLVRASTPVDSSTGSTLSLTAAATAAMVVDPSEVMSHLGGVAWRGVFPLPNSTSLQSVGGTFTFGGTAAAAAIAATNYLTLQAARSVFLGDDSQCPGSCVSGERRDFCSGFDDCRMGRLRVRGAVRRECASDRTATVCWNDECDLCRQYWRTECARRACRSLRQRQHRHEHSTACQQQRW
jgi:hypothetical protein